MPRVVKTVILPFTLKHLMMRRRFNTYSDEVKEQIIMTIFESSFDWAFTQQLFFLFNRKSSNDQPPSDFFCLKPDLCSFFCGLRETYINT